MKEFKTIAWLFLFYMSMYTIIDCKLSDNIDWIYNISISLFFSLLISRIYNYGKNNI